MNNLRVNPAMTRLMISTITSAGLFAIPSPSPLQNSKLSSGLVAFRIKWKTAKTKLYTSNMETAKTNPTNYL